RGIGGTYYIHVRVNTLISGDPVFSVGVFEGGATGNNLGSAPIPVTYREPDLQVTNLVVPGTPPVAGEQVSVSWAVVNQGTRATREAGWRDRVYLSRDPSVDRGDLLLGTFVRSGGLSTAAPNNTYPASLNVPLPLDAQGSYYLLVYTDAPDSLDPL